MDQQLTIPKWNDVLVELNKSPESQRYSEKLNKKVKTSRSHIREIVKLLALHKLILIIPTNKIKKLKLTAPVKTGDILIKNVSDLPCNIIATRNVQRL